MNETKFVRKKEAEYIIEATETEPAIYEKVSYLDDGRYKFFLRFIMELFIPCPDCQKKLHKMISESDKLILGNRDYYPPIELKRDWEVIEKSYETLEQHEATRKDFIAVYGEIGKKHWKETQETS